MNKCLFLLLSVFVFSDAFASISVSSGKAVINNEHNINFEDIKDKYNKFEFSNSSIVIKNFADWQNWSAASVDIKENVILYVNKDTLNTNEVLKYITPENSNNLVIQDMDRLYKTKFKYDGGVLLEWRRETNYQNVFDDSRGDFLEKLRLNNPNNKMLSAMDSAINIDEINSIMNSSYYFNPMILMNPIKTINRSYLNSFFDENSESGIGADVEYLMSGKINNFGAHIRLNNKYENLYFSLRLNFNKFSYSDSLNDFDGYAYGLDIRAKQYIKKFWLDGIIGINRSMFNTGDIFVNQEIKNNPRGMSEYGRLSAGYDFNVLSDFIVAPFMGLMLQRNDILNMTNTDINLHVGANAKYNFVTDGIKYMYSLSLSGTEKAYWAIGAKVGFLSISDNAGITIGADVFRDEFDTNYKISANAKMYF